MKFKIVKIIFFILILCNSSVPGFCTQLPEDVVSYVKEKFPEAAVRFDGFIELPDKTNYLPVLPLVYEKNIESLEVKKTIPLDKDLTDKPDLILFNNNLALMRIIEKENEPPTVISGPEVPLKVKLGLLPQDLVVPKGLVLPVELKVILGDLKIPLQQRTDKEGDVAFYEVSDSDEIKDSPASDQNALIGKTAEYAVRLPELKFLNEKNIYTSTYKHEKLNVIEAQTGRVKKAVELPSKIFDMTLSSDGRYILLLGSAKDEVFIVDTVDDQFIRSIKVGKFPSSIVSPKGNNFAFVANSLSSTISQIDLKHMVAEKEIPVFGFPENLQSGGKNFLFYNDRQTGKVYLLNTKTEKSKELLQVNNISKLAKFDKYLLVLSRSENTLTIYDILKEEVIKRVETGKKPLDFAILNKVGKILVLCAESDELNLIDIENFEMLKKIALDSNGFPGRIELVNDDNKALITNYDSYEIIIYNIDTERIQGHLPMNNTISRVIVRDK